MTRPTYQQSGIKLLVSVTPSPPDNELRSVQMDAVIDVDAKGTALGVELISPAFYTQRELRGVGEQAFREAFSTIADGEWVTYDVEADAAYFRLRPGSPAMQRVVSAELLLSKDNALCGIEVTLK